MINLISDWAGELVVSLVIVTLIEMLLPDNNIKKYVKTVIGVYIIFCILSPFINKEQFSTIVKNTEKSLKKIQIESQVSTSNDNSSIENLYIQEFEKDVIKKVEGLGYKVKKCNVNIEIDASKENAGINSIYLEIRSKKINSNENIEIEEIEKVEISINDAEEGNNKNENETKDTKELKQFLCSYYEINENKIKINQI